MMRNDPMSYLRFIVHENGSSGLYDENGELVVLPLRMQIVGYCYLTYGRLQGHGVSPPFWLWVLRRWVHRQWPKRFAAAPVNKKWLGSE